MADLAPISLLKRMELWQQIDPYIRTDVLAAIGEGMTIPQAARYAGLMPQELRQMMAWGEEGRYPWDPFLREINRAVSEAQVKPSRRRKDIASLDDATMHETTEFLKVVNPEDYGPQQAEAVAGAGGPSLTVVINKQFPAAAGVAGAQAPALPDPNVVDAELVE
jgi:hypothetical protein